MEKVTVAELLPILENTGFKLDEQPYSSLFKIYQKEFLEISVSTGLIHADALALAGDGTPIVTSHRERKKRICKCKENGIHDCNSLQALHSAFLYILTEDHPILT